MKPLRWRSRWWLLTLMSAFASFCSIAGYVGFNGHHFVRVAVVVALVVLAVVAALYELVASVALWRSVPGARFTMGYHLARMGSAFTVLIVAVGVGVVFIGGATHSPVKDQSTNAKVHQNAAGR